MARSHGHNTGLVLLVAVSFGGCGSTTGGSGSTKAGTGQTTMPGSDAESGGDSSVDGTSTGGAEEDGSSGTGGGQSQTEQCADLLTCAAAAAPDEFGDVLESYGPDATCWASTVEVAAQCDEACGSLLAQLRQDNPMDPACSAPGGVSFSEDLAPIFANVCAPSCHEPGGEWAMLDMSVDPHLELVGMPAAQAGDLMNYIEPGDPEQSYLWHKLNGTQVANGGAGLDMPRARPGREAAVIPAADLDNLETWILAGALDN